MPNGLRNNYIQRSIQCFECCSALLRKKWSKKVAENFLFIFYDRVDAIANNPNIGRKTNKNRGIRKILITKHNMLYYEVSGNRIKLLTIFFTVQDPSKNKFE